MGPKSVTNSTPKNFSENSEDTIYSKLVKCEPGEEIAITGISGVYPKADNIKELAEKLWSKEDLVSEVSCQEEGKYYKTVLQIQLAKRKKLRLHKIFVWINVLIYFLSLLHLLLCNLSYECNLTLPI